MVMMTMVGDLNPQVCTGGGCGRQRMERPAAAAGTLQYADFEAGDYAHWWVVGWVVAWVGGWVPARQLSCDAIGRMPQRTVCLTTCVCSQCFSLILSYCLADRLLLNQIPTKG